MNEPAPGSTSRNGRLANLALAIAAPLLALALVEGCSSGLIALRGALDVDAGPVVRRHDERLGWVSLPSLSVLDMFGPGRHLHTNARGFRGQQEVDPRVPEGRIRVVCSGNSFAFGEGVDDADTWCHQLALLDPRIEALNLGQSGYGVDQAYLRYLQDTAGLELHLHVFSFIGPDLTRAGRGVFHGFAKPVFRLDGDELALTGVPVPERLPALQRVALGFVEQLRSSEFIRRGRQKLFGKPRRRSGEHVQSTGPLVERIFTAAARASEAQGATTVFVYLPLSTELERDGGWRGWVRDHFARSGLPFVDLTDALRERPLREADDYYLRKGVPGGGHFSERGNAWAAQHIHDTLRARIDALAARPDL